MYRMTFKKLGNNLGCSLRYFITYEKIPGPKGLPIVGNLFDIKPYGDFDILSFRTFLNQIHDKYGDVVRWSIFNQKQVFLFNPDHIKEVFRRDGSTPIRSQLEPLIKLHKKVNISSALINSQGERWRKLRSVSNPIIAKPQTIKSYLPNHNIIADELVNSIVKKAQNNNEIIIDEFQIYLRMLALEYISEITFDQRLKCLNEDTRSQNVLELNKAIDEFSEYAGRLFFSAPFWKIYPTKDWLLFEKPGVFIYNEVRRYINDAYQYHLQNKSNEMKQTVLGQYLEKMDKYNLTIDDIIGTMAEILIGSIDTTSATLHYILYEIAVNKDIQDKLHKELITIMGNENQITEEHLEKFKYVKHVVKEAMRLHSVAPTNSRIITEDIKLDEYLIPKKTQVFFSNAQITRSEKHFKNALKFDPSRWERDESGAETINPYSSLPFGTGIRSCLGRRLAEQEIFVTIIKILKNFQMDYLSTAEPGFKIALIAAPATSLKIKFTKRF